VPLVLSACLVRSWHWVVIVILYRVCCIWKQVVQSGDGRLAGRDEENMGKRRAGGRCLFRLLLKMLHSRGRHR
jgi:hypothetical protein